MQRGPVGGRVALDRRTVPAEVARGRGEQRCEKAQEARLAAAIGPNQDQRAARTEPEIETGENQSLAAPAGEVLADEFSRFGKRAQKARPFDRTRCEAYRLAARTQKAAPEGEFRSRTGLADGIGRIVGLGDKPVRTNPTDRKMVPNCDVRLNKLRRFGDES